MNHPGTITYVDGTTETVRPVDTVPESLRFAPDTSGQLVPIVRVVATLAGDRRYIREYDAQGRELRSTVQVRRG